MTTDRLRRIVRAGSLTALTDGLFSSVLSAAFYGSTVTRLFQGVASTVLGTSAFNGGLRTAAIGILMHIGVAFAWATIFVLVVSRWAAVRRVLDSRYGWLKVAAIYGPFVWLVMSFAVIPALVRRPPAVTLRWWVQLIGHFPFVGVPIVTASSAGERADGAAFTHAVR